ncbi:hypothetical protein Droror1_Dr00021280 [Drosera rotundifolia]
MKIIGCGPRLANPCLVDMRLGMFPHLQRLKIADCDSFECFPADDSLPTSLTYLGIRRFKRLKKLDVFWLRSLTNLEELRIADCPLLESLGYCSSDDEFPFNSTLRFLDVRNCENLKTINGAWLRSFTSLEALHIDHCVKLEKLDVFWLRSLTNLEELAIHNCPLLESLGYSSDVDDCSSLRVLRVRNCENVKTINGAWLRSFTSLQELAIFDCVKLEALPEGGLPRSLTELWLGGFKNINRQDWIAIQNLTSLEILKIYDCRGLNALPVKLPCSLKKLRLLGNHRDLTERCKRDTGPDWPNIAHVPDIVIWNDDEW